MNDQTSTLVCLDLEGTLISNAVSQIPRSNLYSFLTEVRAFAQLVLFTSVSPARTREIQRLLISEGTVPHWFGELDALHPAQTVKQINQAVDYAPRAKRYFLIDDHASCIEENHRDWWIEVNEFLPPYDKDEELLRVLSVLRKKCSRHD